MPLESSSTSSGHVQSFKMKKLAVLGLIGFNCVLYLIAIFMAFRDASNGGEWIFHYSSILVLIFLIPIEIIQLLQGYFVYKQYTSPLYGHIFMVVNFMCALACLWCAIKMVKWWFIWILVLFTVALAAGMVIYWLALKKLTNKKRKDTSGAGATFSGTGATLSGTGSTSPGTGSTPSGTGAIPSGTGAGTFPGTAITPCSPLIHNRISPNPSASTSKSTTSSCKSISKTPSLPSKPS